MNIKNPTIITDSYKLVHWPMYPAKTEYVYSYFESRNGAHFNETVFFGLQYIIKEYLSRRVTQKDIEEGEALVEAHLGDRSYYNRAMWQHIVDNHGGRLPLEIRAVAEGSVIPVSNVLMTVVNTDPKCAALTNHFETLLTHVWGPSTVATLSWNVRKVIKGYLDRTCDNKDSYLLDFRLHDFGFRGVNQFEAAGIAGAGHLVNSMGTDTIAAMQFARQYYNSGLNGLAYSVPATEHSIMTSMGEEGEKELFGNLLDRFPTGILSVVIDSYDYGRFISEYAEYYKEKILARQGKVVFRPDSGDPIQVSLDVLKRLEKVFGSTVNNKGYKVLPPQVGMLWGDGIEAGGIERILWNFEMNGWSAENIVFGMGGGLLQKINRDTQRFAFKSSAQCVDGQWKDVFKNPLDKSKASKRGRLALIKDETGYKTITRGDEEVLGDLLKTVFLNGVLIRDQSLSDIRERALKG